MRKLIPLLHNFNSFNPSDASHMMTETLVNIGSSNEFSPQSAFLFGKHFHVITSSWNYITVIDVHTSFGPHGIARGRKQIWSIYSVAFKLSTRGTLMDKSLLASSTTGAIISTSGEAESQTETQYIPWIMHVVHTLLWFRIGWFYPYPLGLFHWHWGNHMIAPVPVKQLQRIWVNKY